MQADKKKGQLPLCKGVLGCVDCFSLNGRNKKKPGRFPACLDNAFRLDFDTVFGRLINKVTKKPV